MDPGSVGEIGREAIYVRIMISAPVLILSLVVGWLISLFQALTKFKKLH